MDKVQERYTYDLEDEEAILGAARRIIDKRFLRLGTITNAEEAGALLSVRMAGDERECLCVLFLDSTHQVIAIEDVFVGTHNECVAHPREIARLGLKHNAAAVILAHNHPSGSNEPSQSDITYTAKTKEALALFGIKVLDHLVIGAEVSSMAKLGML